ncbi:MAG: alpha/beta hydrolase family protein, partial [Bdellovibrionota bacterium]
RGGSAGGYTTLAALTFTKGVISVGASYYGVSDLQLLAKETHKLESRYLDQLVGPYPEAIALYKERSPLERSAELNCPVIFFQGDEDKVVPPNQSELMYEVLKKKGIYSEYHLYAGEGHGFRKAETLQHSLKAEHGFYAKVFGFEVQGMDKI